VFLHAPQAISAMQSGKDVLVEKPMAATAAEAANMIETARSNGCRLAVAYFRRFWPHLSRVREILASGRLGQIVEVAITLQSWYHPSPYDPKSWRTVRACSGGGVLADVGSHRLDLLAWWFGLPLQLVARSDTLTHDYDVEDAATILMVLAGGAHATASFRWNTKVWSDEICITGTDSELVLNPLDSGTISIRGADGQVQREDLPKPDNGHLPMIEDFVRSICDDGPPRFGAEDGFQATRILSDIAESSRTGGWVKLG
jgi:predicted dehydrogenase